MMRAGSGCRAGRREGRQLFGRPDGREVRDPGRQAGRAHPLRSD